MRKQKATVASIAAIRSSEKKVATREIKRLGNLTAEQMRLSGEKMQPHEMSMLDFK
jgi:phage host-nuclease inhibitor protein Gam